MHNMLKMASFACNTLSQTIHKDCQKLQNSTQQLVTYGRNFNPK